MKAKTKIHLHVYCKENKLPMELPSDSEIEIISSKTMNGRVMCECLVNGKYIQYIAKEWLVDVIETVEKKTPNDLKYSTNPNTINATIVKETK